jgi:ribosomal protein L37AE/L43A
MGDNAEKVYNMIDVKLKAGDELVCPLCRESDHHNRVNGKAWCFKCRMELVPQSDLKKYNREWRRRFKPKGAKK